MKRKLSNIFVVFFWVLICSLGFSSAAMAKDNGLKMDTEYAMYNDNKTSFAKTYIKFSKDGIAEYGGGGYVSDIKDATVPSVYEFYQGSKYYLYCGLGDSGKYKVNGSKITIILGDSDEPVYLKLKMNKDGNLQVTYSQIGIFEKGDVLHASDVKISISPKKVVCNGKLQKPKVTVEYKGKTLPAKCYTVNYRLNKYSGWAFATVQGKGTYKTKIPTTELYFIITPPKMKVPTVKAGKGTLQISWGKEKNVKGYELQVSTSKTFQSDLQKWVLNSGEKSKKISDLKNKKNYYVRIRAYSIIGNKKYYGDWSTVKMVKTK